MRNRAANIQRTTAYLQMMRIRQAVLLCYLPWLKQYYNYAYVSTIAVGLQIVDVEKARLIYKKSREAIIGGYDTVNNRCGEIVCGQPVDVVAYRSGYVLMTTMRGNVLIFNVNMPNMPTLASYTKLPDTHWRAGAVSDYTYIDKNGMTKTIDLAIIGGVSGRPILLDITDPVNPKQIGQVNDFTVGMAGVAISKSAKLAYITGPSAVYVVDIKDPAHPVLLNQVGAETYADGSSVSLPALRRIVEKDGWVYMADYGGMSLVDLGGFNVNVVDKDGIDISVAKFSDGTDEQKDYFIKIKVPDAAEYCNDQNLTGHVSVKTVRDAKEEDLSVPADAGYPSRYDLTFIPGPNNTCLARIRTPHGEKDKIFITNRSKDGLTATEERAPLYGGIEPAKLVTRITGGAGGNNLVSSAVTQESKVDIEGTQIIVLAIDGLRQDVLYAAFGSGTPNAASYNDPSGCGGSCKVDIGTLKDGGIKEILAGYDKGVSQQKYIMLPDVTAIFPSVTLASWASVFTGKMPKETGIPGNEFFARDLNEGVPEKLGAPAGMITLDGGAFPGFGEYSKRNMLTDSTFFLPRQGNWKDEVKPEATPQNGTLLREDAKTVYESIGVMDSVKKAVADGGGDPSVVAYNHYARGARWLTWSTAWPFGGSSQFLDSSSWLQLESYLNGQYLKEIACNPDPHFANQCTYSRNNKPFSALTVWYLAGLDHEAHIKGMTAYRTYFIEKTDDYINKLVSWLAANKELENKIFIIVADHGTTQMPMNLTYPDKNWLGGNVQRPAEMSCELKLDFGDSDNPNIAAQKAEKYNNNLHIWELGEVLKSIGESGWGDYLVLAPHEISTLFKNNDQEGNNDDPTHGAIADKSKANVIAALNGPMAHIYLRSGSVWDTTLPEATELRKLAQYIKLYLKDGGAKIVDKEIKNNFKKLLSSVDTILIRENNTYKIFNGFNVASGEISDGAEYVKAIMRIDGLNDLKRSGDIVLIMKDKTHINAAAGETIENSRYTTGVACKAWHGSLNPSDSYVPLIVAYPGGTKIVLEQIIDNTTGCKVATGCDGNWRVTDLIKKLIENQYKAK